MNSRSYPRTTWQAFPRSVERACALERPAPNKAGKIAWIAFAAGALYLACFFLSKVYA